MTTAMATGQLPTKKQYRLLRILGSGAIALVPARRDWETLVRRGWVEPASDRDDSRYLPPLQITPDGYHALARGLQSYGHEPLSTEQRAELMCSEPAFVAKLRRDLDEARQERDRAQDAATLATRRLASVKRAVAEVAA